MARPGVLQLSSTSAASTGAKVLGVTGVEAELLPDPERVPRGAAADALDLAFGAGEFPGTEAPSAEGAFFRLRFFGSGLDLAALVGVGGMLR